MLCCAALCCAVLCCSSGWAVKKNFRITAVAVAVAVAVAAITDHSRHCVYIRHAYTYSMYCILYTEYMFFRILRRTVKVGQQHGPEFDGLVDFRQITYIILLNLGEGLVIVVDG